MATKIITAYFTTSGVPVAGLTPTIDIYELDTVNPSSNPQVVNDGAAVEIGGGWYRYDFTSYDTSKSYVFTFDGGSSLSPAERYVFGGNESYRRDVADGVWEQPAVNYTSSGSTGLLLNQIKADTASLAIASPALVDYLELLLKYQRNRTRIDLTNSQLVIYDNDGTTPLTVFDLKDFNGMPNVQEVCEKVPVI